MEDWLVTFGTFQLNLPAGTGAANHYLPVNNKSLVVSISPILPILPSRLCAFLSFFFLLDDFFIRYPFCQLVLSSERFSRFQWEIWLVVNGES